MSLVVTVRDLPAIPLAVVRRTGAPGTLGPIVQEGCGTVWKFVRAHGLKAGRNVAVYLNGNIDIEVGVEILSPFDEADGVVRSATPAGLIAAVTHLGPYHNLGAAYDAIRAFCAANKYRTAGASWEIYGHWLQEWNTNPAAIRTDVFQQVRPA